MAIKFTDEGGEVQTVRKIYVHYKEEKNYDGVPSIEYDCSLEAYGKECKGKLVFFKEECRWVLRASG